VSTASSKDERALDNALTVGQWHVDPAGNQLSRNGESTRLEPKAIEVLVYLARRAGQVVGREELLSAVWPGVIVGDDALTQAIIKLRKALGDDARQPTYIETISKRGYRLLAPVIAPTASAAATSQMARRAGDRRKRLSLVLAGAAIVATLAVLIVPNAGRLLGLSWLAGRGQTFNTPGETTVSRPIVAVLPLANQSGDPRRDYFTDGLTEDIIYALGRFSGLGVISRNAVEPFKTRPASPQAIKSELGARYLVIGSVRESDRRLRITVELSDADKGTVLWSERYEGEGKDVFEIQDRIVKNIVGALAVKVTRLEEERAASKPPQDLEAYDLALRARALLVKSDRVANRQARVLLAKALQLAPDYAEAYVLSTDAEIQRSMGYGWTEDPGQSLQRAEQYAQKVLALDDPGAQARAHGQLGVLYAAAGKLDQALAEAERAIELNPSDAFAFDTRGHTLLYAGRAEEAIASMEAALRFNPVGRNSGSAFDRALAYYTLRRYRDSLAAADAALARYPDAAFLHAIRAASLAQLGDREEARNAAARVRRFDPFFAATEFGNRFVKPEHMAHLQEGLRKAGL
jgi:adenylate cyclase